MSKRNNDEERRPWWAWGVSTVTEWYRAGLFRSADEVRGAYRLANQQWLDGTPLFNRLSKSPSEAEWLGLTKEEFKAWAQDGTLPAGGEEE